MVLTQVRSRLRFAGIMVASSLNPVVRGLESVWNMAMSPHFLGETFESHRFNRRPRIDGAGEGERAAVGGGVGSAAALFLLPGGRVTKRDFAEQ